MKNFNHLITNFLKGGVTVLFLLIASSVFAQSGFTLTWDSEVGCLEYDFDKKRNETVEGINEEDCILVCEESIVNFNIDYGNQDVTNVSWETDGGEIFLLGYPFRCRKPLERKLVTL